MSLIVDQTKYGQTKVVNFTKRLMKSWQQDDDKGIKNIYSSHNDRKAVVAERFIGTLEYKIYKYKNSISKNVYIDKLADIINEYNNTYQSTIKMKPANLNSSIDNDFDVGNNDKDSKFEVGDHVTISKYKSIFAKFYDPNWSEEAFTIKKVKSTVPWTYLIEEFVGNCQNVFYKRKIKQSLGCKK